MVLLNVAGMLGNIADENDGLSLIIKHEGYNGAERVSFHVYRMGGKYPYTLLVEQLLC
jgi:hypothetical protein